MLMDMPDSHAPAASAGQGLSAARSWRRRAAVVALWTGVMLAGWMILLPWAPEMPSESIDASWQMVLIDAFLRGRRAGWDYVFTYGPLGFAMTPMYHPRTFVATLLLQGLIIAALVLTMATWQARRTLRIQALAAGVGLLVIALLAISPTRDPVVFLLVPLWGLAILRLRQAERSGRVLAMRWAEWDVLIAHGFVPAVLAVVSLTKFSYNLVIGPAIIVVTLVHLSRKPRHVIPTATYVVTLVLTWLLLERTLLNIGSFLRGSWDVSSRYTDAMGWGYPLDPWLLMFLALSMLALLLALAGARWREDRAASVCAAMLLASACFPAWKAGLVRFDAPHLAITLSFLATLAVWTQWTVWSQRQPAILRAGAALGLALVLATFVRANFVLGQEAGLTASVKMIARVGQNNLLRFQSLHTGRRSLQSQYAASIARIQQAIPRHPDVGTIDFIPLGQAIAIAHGYDYRPRPVFQSYKAYSHWLCVRNMDYVVSPQRPQNLLLFVVSGLDNRLPLVSDGVLWPFLLAYYQPMAKQVTPASVPFEFWELRSHPRDIRIEHVSTKTIAIDEPWDVPAIQGSEMIYARIFVSLSVAGKLCNFLLQSPAMELETQTADGAVRPWRVPMGCLQSGFILSPGTEKAQRPSEAFAFPAPSEPNARRVVKARLLVGPQREHAWAFESQVIVKLERYRLE